MKTAFIATVFNDEEGTRRLLNSLLSQSVIPSEIIIVDAKSSDGTPDIVNEFVAKFPKGTARLLVKKSNRSKGRNWAIRNLKNDLVAVSDAGCVLDRFWFEKITAPFADKKIDVVAGFYKPKTKNVFEKCLACYTSVMSDKVTQEFLPSSRSIAFKKSAWQKTGGYPEYLDTCEDLVFAQKMKKSGFNFFIEKNAFVWWPQKKDLIGAFYQLFSYAKGDGAAMYFRFQTPILFLRYLVVFCLVLSFLYSGNTIIPSFLAFAFLLYALWAILKNYKYVKKYRALLYLPVLQITSDIAVILGMIVGFFEFFKRKLML